MVIPPAYVRHFCQSRGADQSAPQHAGTLGMPGSIGLIWWPTRSLRRPMRGRISAKLIQLRTAIRSTTACGWWTPGCRRARRLRLPDAFVFCFTATSTRSVAMCFAIWMSVLGERPGSDAVAAGVTEMKQLRRLRLAASGLRHRPEPVGVRQTPALPQHLARHAQADLFIDTWPTTRTPPPAMPFGRVCRWSPAPARPMPPAWGASLLRACGCLKSRARSAGLSAQAPGAVGRAVLQAIRRQLLDCVGRAPV